VPPRRLKVRKELEAQMVHRPGHSCLNCPQVPDEHVRMHDYFEHQRSAEQIDEKEARKRAGAIGNHSRGHVVPKKDDPNFPHCITDGSHVRSQPGSQNRSQESSKRIRMGSPKILARDGKDKERGYLPVQPFIGRLPRSEQLRDSIEAPMPLLLIFQ
jgi:hypothetical protein